jgi:hypothetical protein
VAPRPDAMLTAVRVHQRDEPSVEVAAPLPTGVELERAGRRIVRTWLREQRFAKPVPSVSGRSRDVAIPSVRGSRRGSQRNLSHSPMRPDTPKAATLNHRISLVERIFSPNQAEVTTRPP